MTKVTHGQRACIRAGEPAHAMLPVPPEWAAYCGHYRGHNPWLSNFRVFIRAGGLWLAWGSGEEYALTPLGEHTFRVEDDPDLPERLRFEWPAEGSYLQAWFSGGRYDLFFTE